MEYDDCTTAIRAHSAKLPGLRVTDHCGGISAQNVQKVLLWMDTFFMVNKNTFKNNFTEQTLQADGPPLALQRRVIDDNG